MTIHDFIRKHGDYATAGGWRWFEDGAKAEATDGGVFSYEEPPDNPTQRLRNQRQYLLAKIARLSTEFRQAHSNAMTLANLAVRSPNSVPGITTDTVEALRKGRDDIEQWQAKLDALEDELAKTPEAIADRTRQDLLAEQAAAQQELAAEVAAITI